MPVKTMHVVLFTNAFPNAAEPQRGAFTVQIAQALKELTDLDIVAPLPFVPRWMAQRHPIASVAAVEHIEALAVHHPRYLVLPKIAGATHAATLALAALPVLRSIRRQKPIDLINAHWIYPDGVAAVWIGKRLGIPVSLTALGCDINAYANMPLRRPQIVWALEHACGIGAVSRNLKDGMLALLKERRKGLRPGSAPFRSFPNIRVIPNGVDAQRFSSMSRSQAREILGLPTEGRIVLTVGSQDEVKGTRYLIEACGLLADLPDLRLVLVGDGPLRQALGRLSQDLGISDRVIFAGKRDHAEVALWMNAADVFCLPSLREGHPNVVMEALACGTPVVASDVGAVSEILSSETGLLVPPANAQRLAGALRHAFRTPWNRERIRNSVEGSRWEDCAARYLDWYREILGGVLP